MTNRQITLTSALTLCLALSMSAQQPAPRASQSEQAPCERFKMRIVEPGPAAHLAKTPEVQPDPRIEYKGIVIDPCAQPDAKFVKPVLNRTDRPKPPPLLKLNPEPENKLLTPAELLKKLSQPVAPKPKP